MSPWNRGREVVEELIANRHLEKRPGADHGVDALMGRARQQLTSARTLLVADPITAYTTAYDAAKHAGMALLAEQNLRTTSQGGHLAIERVLNAQFPVFTDYRRLRQRRNDLDYPTSAEDFATTEETEHAITRAEAIVDAAETLLAQKILTTYT